MSTVLEYSVVEASTPECLIFFFAAEIAELTRVLGPTPEEVEVKQGALDRVSAAVRAVWPSSRVEVFGSFVTGTAYRGAWLGRCT